MVQSLRNGVSVALVSSFIAALSLLGMPEQGHAQGSASASAQQESGGRILRSLSSEQLKAIMVGEGYAVTTDDDGDLVWKVEGYRALILFAKDRESIQFRAAFGDGNATLRKVNEWNKRVKYSRSYLDDDGNPVLELDLDLAGGVTQLRILDFLKTCRVSFSAWNADVVR